MTKDQFDDRYRIDPKFPPDPAARKRSKFVISRQKEASYLIRIRPSNIDYFESILEEPPQRGNIPLIGFFCNMIPVELLMAFGARAIRLGCGNAALVQSGEEVLSGDICPLAKASFAQFMDESHIASQCDCLVIPTSCDAKKKMGEVLSDIKPVFMLNLPVEQDYSRYAKIAVAEIERLTAFLQNTLRAKFDKNKLLKAIETTNRRSALVREMMKYRGEHPAAMSVRDLFTIIQASTKTDDFEQWLAQARVALDELKSFKPDRARIRPRIVLTGAPVIWPNFKVLNIIEECGADVVADTLCTGVQSVFDPVVVEEKSISGLFRSLAQRYMFASPCPCFVSQGTRISRILDLVSELRADGVVHYGLRLCQLFDMETYRLSRVLKANKIPFMNLTTDYSLEDTEQIRVRLEAFLETLGEIE